MARPLSSPPRPMDAPPSSSRSPRPRLVVGGRMPPPPTPPPPPDNDRTAHELRASDCNLAALCDHVKHEGFNAGAFSDVVVEAMGSTFRLHRLILSRSSYFRNMLHGPWKEADAPTVTLQIDDDNINNEAISMALAYLYGHHPKLNDNNAFRVLAAASFLDLQDLCAICTDFIISELWISNFLVYQVFAESQDYGIHGERVRKACWGYLCQSGTMELREVLPKLSSQTLHSLLTSDRLWVPNEEKRFELALYTLLAKGALAKEFMEKAILSSESGLSPSISSSQLRQQEVTEDIDNKMTSELEDVNIQNDADCEIDFESDTSYSRTEKIHEVGTSHPITDSYTCEMEKHVPPVTSISGSNIRSSCAYAGTNDDLSSVRMVVDGSATDAPSEENSGYPFNNDVWLSREQPRHFSSDHSPCNSCSNDEWGKSTPCWGARTVGWSQGKHAEENHGIYGDDYDTFVSIFEGGSLLYCNMSFEALLNVRKQLEELGFPCKAVNDGLWLQMLLSHRVHEIGADTCRNCCMISMSCTCPPPYGCSQGASTGYYSQEHDLNDSPGMGNVYFSDAQGEGTGTYGPVRVHVRGPIDGLAGIGRGTTFVQGGVAWPPTRYVFSRVPFGLGSRNGQQSLGNDDLEARIDHNGEFPADGLTALVGHCHGGTVGPVHMEHAQRAYVPGSVNLPTSNSIQLQILESQQQGLGSEWESAEVSSLSLDMKTPLHRFPPFRFGVEFIDVHRLVDGQVKHSPEVFYAGSLWKVSVQAFNDEDSQGRRTLGLFLHRRKAEPTNSSRKFHMYVDSREKVTARYQLICPSKREVMVFGSLKQPGTLLPKAPKGWGWRTALLFEELGDLLQGGALRVAAVVQLI